MEGKWLVRVFEQAEKKYEQLPEWKKRLWAKEDFLNEQKQTSSIRERRYDPNDWT